MGRKEPAVNRMYEKVACGGMDVHYKFSNVTFRDAQGKVVCRERLEHRDKEALVKHLSQWPRGVPIAMEGSFGWAWISDLMIQLGLNPQLANSLKVERMREARGWAKTNKKDADLVSLLPLEKSDWWKVWTAPPEVRDRREWTRFRADLVKTQTQVKNRIHAIFHRHGIFHDFSDLFGAGGRRFLGQLCQDGAGVLSGGALWAFKGQVMLLEHVRKQLADLMRELRQHLQRTAVTCHLKKTIPGFGLVLPHVVVAEVGDMARFEYDHKRFASYCLLAPRAQDSGEQTDEPPVGRKLGRRGNRVLKWALLEAARAAVRKGGIWRAMYDRYTQGGRKQRNRGYIKVARGLAKQVVKEWKKALGGPEEGPSVPQASSPKKHRRGGRGRGSTRSGTGAPYHPMVQA
jgi:transposase